jgi:hypothetical protein
MKIFLIDSLKEKSFFVKIFSNVKWSKVELQNYSTIQIDKNTKEQMLSKNTFLHNHVESHKNSKIFFQNSLLNNVPLFVRPYSIQEDLNYNPLLRISIFLLINLTPSLLNFSIVLQLVILYQNY